MLTKRSRSSQEWFSIWNEIISLEDTLSRVRLSEISRASVQTIKSLQKDWMVQNPYVSWDRRSFKLFNLKDIYLSNSTSNEQEKLK